MIKILVKYKVLFLLLVIIITGLALSNVKSIVVNTNFFQFLPDNDSEYDFYKQMKLEIKDDESLLIIGIRNEESIYNKNFIKKVQSFTDSLAQINEFKNIKGLTNLSYPMNSFFGLNKVPYLEIKDSVDIKSYQNKIAKDFEITQNFVNKEGTILLIWIEIESGMDNLQIKNVLGKIEHVRGEFPELETYLWGKKYLEFSLSKIMTNEVKDFIIWILLFLLLSLSIIFRKPKAIICSVLLVLISIIIFTGGMAYLKRPFGMMSNLFPTIILIVGISDIIHLSIKYNIEKNKGKTYKETIYNMINEIGWALFITSFTTAVGFFILYLSPMKVLRDFGLEAGIAVMLTFILTLLLTPIFFTDIKNKGHFSLSKRFLSFSDKLFSKLAFLQNYPNTVLIFYGVFILIATFGIYSINTNNQQFSIPNNSELKTNYSFFEKYLGGSRTFELVLLAKKDHKLNEPDILKSVNNIHNYLDSLPYLYAVKSPVLYYRIMHKAYFPSTFDNVDFTLDKKSILKYEKLFNKSYESNYLFNKQKTIYKFNAQMIDLGRHDVATKNKDILNHVKMLIDTTKTNVRISGLDFLFDRSHEQNIYNMLLGLLMAIIIVGFTLGIIFKNFGLTLLALLLNIIPIIITAGIMGFTNLELRSGTSIIFTIAFVIAVDNTIHLLSKFQWERKKGRSVEDAINLAIQECGKAILATSIILMGGFFVLMLSDFNEIFTLGFLMGVVILITLSVDLILAPILILKWFKKYL